MQPWKASLQALLLAIWVGSLWTIGWVPVILFRRLQEVPAGNIANQLFGIGAWIGMACGALLIVLRLSVPADARPARDWILWALAVMLALTLIEYFGINAIMDGLRQQAAPLSIRESPLRAQFGMWHGISSTLYLIRGVTGLLLVALAPRARR
ncbi:MAG TPA: DUF4149 domain-containing protein [Burkholderiales bacterium]